MKAKSKHKEETKKKISLALTGKKRAPFSAEALLNMSLAQKGKKRSEATRRRISEITSGENNHFWKGGISSDNERFRKTSEYKLWRTAVFVRDGYACIWGGKDHGNKLHADHIKPFALFPELRLAIDNGRTLCEDCHRKTETFGGNILKYDKKRN